MGKYQAQRVHPKRKKPLCCIQRSVMEFGTVRGEEREDLIRRKGDKNINNKPEETELFF